MAPLSSEDKELLKEALEAQLRKEELERALGRVLRQRGLGFDRYIAIVSSLREAKEQDEDLASTARRLTTEG